MRYVGDAAWSHDAADRVGVLLINVGTPDDPTSAAVRRYLAEFLRDPRVVEIPRLLWWLILHAIILPFRSPRSARAYRSVWLPEGAPLRVHSEHLREALGRAVADDAKVALGMRYGQPSIAAALDALRAAQARRLLVVPLYPQYCSATTGSAFEAVSDVLRTWRWVPSLRFVTHYHDEPLYVAALAQSLRDHWDAGAPGERLLFSFHGIPKRSVLAGDPYYCQCLKTARLVAESLALPSGRWAVSFQSRLGRAEWLQPYTADQLREWARGGVRRVDVICPGFPADCLETLEEIALRYREDFEQAGGEALRYVPALNARADHVAFLAGLIARNLQGWPEPHTNQAGAAADESARRAREMGAVH